eukprot:jgi/Ulvmu1/2174/UM013_0019.1
MSDYRRIRHNLWHESTTRLRRNKETPQCNCKPASEGGESCSTALCVNRSCMIECDQECQSGNECENQRIQRGIIPSVKVQKFPGSKGMGVIALHDIAAGDLICEYVGEVINQNELARRMANEYRDMRHTYIMTYVRGLLLDATAKGGLGRYLNHSCGPNCETQYWMVKGETRVGIFAKQGIEAGAELCYDYNLQWNGFARVRCECGAPSCSGWLGGRSAAQRANESLRDLDDDAAEGAIYVDEDAEGATKVAQLGAGPMLPPEWGMRRRPRVPELPPPMPAERIQDMLGAFLRAPCRYPSPYDALERADGVPGVGLGSLPAGEREAVEETWREQQRVVQQLLLGMQGIGVAPARSRSGTV